LGEWECTSSAILPESQRISREWRALDEDLANPPEIIDAEQDEVAHMINYCKSHQKKENDFDVIVTAKVLNYHLRYKILEDKVPLTKTGKRKATKAKILAPLSSTTVGKGTSKTKQPSSRPSTAGGLLKNALVKKTPQPEVRTIPCATSSVRAKSVPESSWAQEHNVAPEQRVVTGSKVPLF
jgi:hypothetical protein